jgi:hypothetical protein
VFAILSGTVRTLLNDRELAAFLWQIASDFSTFLDLSCPGSADEEPDSTGGADLFL